MIPSEYQKIFGALYLKTQDKTLGWTSGASEDQYLVSLGGFSIVLSRNTEEFVGQYYSMLLLNSEGKEVDSFQIYDSDTGFKEVHEMFELARRKAARIDEAISQIESALGADDSNFKTPTLTPPPPPSPPPSGSSADDDDLPF